MKFSVVIPTFNRADKIAHAIGCVIAQSYENWELLIVDDGSTDETEEVVRPFLSDDRIQYFFQNNRGVSAARNLGASKAKGGFLVFFDSDDWVETRWLEDFAESIDSCDNLVGYVSCGYYLAGKPFPPRRGREFSSEAYNSASGSFAIKKSVFNGVQGYDEELLQSENWELVARALAYCCREGLVVTSLPNSNLTWRHEKTRPEVAQRDLKRARTYLHLHKKYRLGGVLFHRRRRFLLGAAVNFARSGHLKESRKWFYQSFLRYPSIKAFLRIVCFEIPILRRRLWLSRKVAVVED